MLLLTLFYVVGIGFILLSLYLRYWRGKRKFNRRNVAGMETFPSYDKELAANWLENASKFLYMLFMAFGIIILLAAIFGGGDIMRVTHW